MHYGVRGEGFPTSNGSVYISIRHFALLRNRMCQNCQIPSVKTIQNPIVHSPLSYPQLMDAVSQKIRERPSQLVPEFREALNSGDALRICLSIRPAQFFEPIEDRDISFCLPIEDNLRTGHLDSTLQIITILLSPSELAKPLVTGDDRERDCSSDIRRRTRFGQLFNDGFRDGLILVLVRYPDGDGGFPRRTVDHHAIVFLLRIG
jgi:hypothetical protein